jgi:hypothetical protein
MCRLIAMHPGMRDTVIEHEVLQTIDCGVIKKRLPQFCHYWTNPVWLLLIVCCFSTFIAVTPATARARDGLPADPATCDIALKAAEKEAKIPTLLLRTIALVESGHMSSGGRVTPWAWTINASGVSHTYATKADAIEAAKNFLADGVKSVDIGCMQINLQSHPDAFSSLDEGFDPAANTRYGAHFLTALYRRVGSWPEAAMAYHSQSPDIGKLYEAKVMSLWPLAASYQPATMKVDVATNATAQTDDGGDSNATAEADSASNDPNLTPVFAAWLKQNAEDVARNAADHRLVRD